MSVRNIIAAALILAALASGAWAANATLSDGSFTENFNEMGTGTAYPTGWSGLSIAGSHDTLVPADDTAAGGHVPTSADISVAGTAVTTLTAATPASQKGATVYNWAVGGSPTERALGSSPSGIEATVLQLTITNSTGMDISALNIDYDVRVFSTTTNNNNYNTPYCSTTTGVGTEELPGYWLWISLDGGSTYTNVADLDANGHTWANAIGVVHESAANYALGGTWANGSTAIFRWVDDNAQGPSPDQLLGLDNVVLGTVPEPATMALLAMGGLGLIVRKRRTR